MTQKVIFVATDQGPVVQSAELRSELVRLRKESGLTQEQVAGDLEWSPSKLIRVEGGRSSVTKVDLDALLTKYGVTSESIRDRLQALNRGAREPAWWDKYRADVAATYLNYVGFEVGASFIRHYEAAFVPGSLQIPEYAEAVTIGKVDPIRIASMVGLRLQRQAELEKRSVQPRRYYVVDEAVVRRHVGISKDPAIMPNQLRYMADKAEREDLVTVRVIPFTAGAHRGLTGAFTLLEFDGGLPDVLYIDAGRGDFASMVSGGDLVAEYRDDFESLLEDALSAEKSIDLIRNVAEEMS
jgi:transcriptional regulator with XRE-family HTH domain